MDSSGNVCSNIGMWRSHFSREPSTNQLSVTSKIFAIKGIFPSVKSSLIRRGWIEKKHRFFHCISTDPVMWPFKRDLRMAPDPEKVQLAVENEENAEHLSEENAPRQSPNMKPTSSTLSPNKLALLRYYPPTLIWSSRRDAISYEHLHKNQIVNHFNHGGFTTKVSLCAVVRNVSWTCDVDGNKIFPRCFCIGNPSETEAFIENFKLTSCFNMLKWVSKKAETWLKVIPDGNWFVIPEGVLKFAIAHCSDFLASVNHDDIEVTCEKLRSTDAEWIWFLGWSSRLKDNNSIINEWYCYLVQCHRLCKEIQRVWPQWNIDGDRNVWILKPAAKSRGQGIKICEDLTEILEHVDNGKTSNENGYIVQKYIERPFLMQGTKFDIRQWFLVTDFNPITMWMYKDSYLRFCSIPFTLDNKDASIHLCNNAIQCHYLKSANRLSTLPEGNMITNDEFKAILEERGYSGAWDNIIYPHMQSILIAILKSAQEQMLGRKNCFELYGADFMIDEYLRPWLIEINSSPCLAPTTSVTKKLCARVVDDTLKVVLDRRIDKQCDIGCFELAFQGDKIIPPLNPSFRATLRGNKIDMSNFFCEQPMQKWFQHIEENQEETRESKMKSGDMGTFIKCGSLPLKSCSGLQNGDKLGPKKVEDSNQVFAAIKKATLPSKPKTVSHASEKCFESSKVEPDSKAANKLDGAEPQVGLPETKGPSLLKTKRDSEHLEGTKDITRPSILPKMEDVHKTQSAASKSTAHSLEKKHRNGRRLLCPKGKQKKRIVNSHQGTILKRKTTPKSTASNPPQSSDDTSKEKEQSTPNDPNLREKVAAVPHENNTQSLRKSERLNRTSDGKKDKGAFQTRNTLVKTETECATPMKKKLEKALLSKVPSKRLHNVSKEHIKLQYTKSSEMPADKLGNDPQQRNNVLPKLTETCKGDKSPLPERSHSFSIHKTEHNLQLNWNNESEKANDLIKAPKNSEEDGLDFSGVFKCHTLPFGTSNHSIKNRS